MRKSERCVIFNFFSLIKGCGKTSVLESLIGTGFLPKKFKTADGDAKGGEVKKMMQTRCPVVINLVKVSSVAECREWPAL